MAGGRRPPSAPFVLKGKWVSARREISAAETWSVSAMCLPGKAAALPRDRHLRLVPRLDTSGVFSAEPDHA